MSSDREIQVEERPAAGQTGSCLEPVTDNGTADIERDWLCRIALHQDRAAFAALFRRYAGPIKAYLIKAGSRPEQAEEAMQETMLTIWHKAGSFDPSKAGPAAWIYAIARNKRIDLLRRQPLPAPDAADPNFVPDDSPTAEMRLNAAQRDARVRQAVAKLSSEQREVIRLAYVENLSQTEIAARLRLPLGTVKSRFRLAFGRVRAMLGDQMRDDISNE